MAVLYRKKHPRTTPDPTPLPSVDPTELKIFWVLHPICGDMERFTSPAPLFGRWALIRSLVDHGFFRMDQMDNNDKVFYIAAKIPCTKSDVDSLEVYDRENPKILEQLLKLIKES